MTLPLRKELLRGVLAADLIAFHTFDYVRHFMNSCSRVLGTDITVESNCTRIGIGAAAPTACVHAPHEVVQVGLDVCLPALLAVPMCGQTFSTRRCALQ